MCSEIYHKLWLSFYHQISINNKVNAEKIHSYTNENKQLNWTEIIYTVYSAHLSVISSLARFGLRISSRYR